MKFRTVIRKGEHCIPVGYLLFDTLEQAHTCTKILANDRGILGDYCSVEVQVHIHGIGWRNPATLRHIRDDVDNTLAEIGDND